MRQSDLNKLKLIRSNAEMYRNQLYDDHDMRRYEGLWQGRYETKEEALPVPILVANAQKQKAAIIGPGFQVLITADTAENFAGSRVLTKKLNRMVVDSRMYYQVDLAVQDALTLGSGYLLDGFGSRYGTYDTTSRQGFDPTRYDKKGKRRIEYHSYVEDNLPWTARVHPASVLYPPGTVHHSEAFGVFISYSRHIDDIRADEKLSQKHRNTITANMKMDYGGSLINDNIDAAEDYVLLWDFYDLRNSHRVTFSEDYPNALYDDVDEILVRLDRLPIHPIIFNNNPRYCYGTSDFHLLEAEAEEINNLRSMQKITRKRQIPKVFLDKSKLAGLSEEEYKDTLENMMSDVNMTIIPIDGSPREVIEQFTPHQMPDFFNQIQLAKQEIEQFGAVSMGPNQQGTLSSGRHTKYEAQLAQSHHEGSVMPRKIIVRDALVDAMYNWAQMIYDFWTEPQIVQTYDASGAPIQVEFRGADLRGDYRFDVNIESMQFKSAEQQMEMNNMILAQAQPALMNGVINPHALYRQYLARLNSDWDIESLLMQPAPQQQQVPFDQFSEQFTQPQQQQQQQANPLAQFMKGA